jgi:hypothetical protein
MMQERTMAPFRRRATTETHIVPLPPRYRSAFVYGRLPCHGTTDRSGEFETGLVVGASQAGHRVIWALDPLVVGSIPTRPTNRFKHLASPSGGTFCFVGPRDSSAWPVGSSTCLPIPSVAHLVSRRGAILVQQRLRWIGQPSNEERSFRNHGRTPASWPIWRPFGTRAMAVVRRRKRPALRCGSPSRHYTLTNLLDVKVTVTVSRPDRVEPVEAIPGTRIVESLQCTKWLGQNDAKCASRPSARRTAHARYWLRHVVQGVASSNVDSR